MLSIKRWCKKISVWRESKGFITIWGNVPEKLMLVVTELSEAMEAYRKLELTNLGIDTRKVLSNFNEELADATIRIFDLCGSLDIDLEKEIAKKMKINEVRPFKHGKSC